MFKCPILKVSDNNHPWVVDAMWWQRVFFQYLYTWGWWNDVRKWVRSQETRVPKHLMVEAAQMLFDNNMVEIWDWQCKNLLEQLDHFIEFKNEYTQKSKYKWEKSEHDDFVDCMLYCLWTFWAHLWLSHNKFKVDEAVEYQMNNQEDMDPLHLRAPAPQPRYEGLDNAFWY
jgi:hypothetical protein